MPTVGDRLKSCRIRKGLSADEVAIKIGKHRASLYRYEANDIDNMPISVISALAELYEVSPAYLMGWDDSQKPLTPKKDEGLSEIEEIFTELSLDNQSKLIELSRLFLGAQNSNGEKK